MKRLIASEETACGLPKQGFRMILLLYQISAGERVLKSAYDQTDRRTLNTSMPTKSHPNPRRASDEEKRAPKNIEVPAARAITTRIQSVLIIGVEELWGNPPEIMIRNV